jgi:hypothetical protein
MRYPTPSDYVEALQMPDLAFSDPELAAGVVETNAMGLPRVITGAFAAVFRVDLPSERAATATSYAVRAFLVDDPDRAARYAAVGKRLAPLALPYFAPFEFQPRGITVGERRLPIVRMPWLDGRPLNAFVEAHRTDREALLALRAAWQEMLADLAAAGIAHGDLQHGNVLVQTADDRRPGLRLVDYDTVYVPALRGRKSPEVGQRNFQHPDRTESDFGPEIDHFPGLVFYTALTALAEDPGLWERFDTGENILFQSADFYDPRGSALFDALSRLDEAAPLAEALARACFLEPRAVPPLATAIDSGVEGGLSRRRRQPGDERDRGREGLAALALPAALLTAAIVIALAAAGWFAPAGLVAVVALVGLGVGAAREYRRLSPVRRRHRLAREANVLRQWVGDLEDQEAELGRERAAFLARTGSMREERLAELQEEALARRLKHHFVGELGTDREVGHRAVIRLKQARIRAAHHASGDRLATVKELSSSQRAAVAAWRDRLAARYADEVPEELSAAEERRLQRLVERRLESIAAEMARVREKAAVQRAELARVNSQLEALPRITPAVYAGYLLRLSRLPDARPLTPAGERRAMLRADRVPAGGADPKESWWEEHE